MASLGSAFSDLHTQNVELREALIAMVSVVNGLLIEGYIDGSDLTNDEYLVLQRASELAR